MPVETAACEVKLEIARSEPALATGCVRVETGQEVATINRQLPRYHRVITRPTRLKARHPVSC